jgi:hypothetical protein
LRTRKLPKKSQFDEESAAINLQPKRFAECTQVPLKRASQHYFWSDASNAYWAIPLRKGDEMKTGFITPDGQYCYTHQTSV